MIYFSHVFPPMSHSSYLSPYSPKFILSLSLSLPPSFSLSHMHILPPQQKNKQNEKFIEQTNKQKKTSNKTPHSSFCVGQLAQSLTWYKVYPSSDTPVEKSNFPLASRYRV